MAQKTLTPRKLVAQATIGQEPTVTLPDGRVLTKGMTITITGIAGSYKFMYGRRSGAEVTVYGGTIPGEKSDYMWRTFRPEQVATAGANLVALTLVAKAEATKPAEYAVMTAGQKAAWTKRMNAAAKVAA